MRKCCAFLVACVLAVTGLAAATPAADAAPKTETITLLATTDTHGNVYNWDYFRNAPYTDKQGNAIGLAAAGAVINQIRAERGAESVVVVDNGDILQGTPLDYYYAKQEPVTQTGAVHPMAAAMNAIGYDAVNVGNHEFNYGLDHLMAFRDDLDAPLLGANVVDATTGQPVLTPYTIVTRKLKGAKPIRIGILGLTTPGSQIWDQANLAGKVRIEDMVTAAKQWVPRVRAAGADIVVVLSHAGTSGLSSYEAAGIGGENETKNIAVQVPGIDVLVAGHSHQDVPSTVVTNVAGQQVLIAQPKQWAMGVADITLDLAKVRGQWTVTSKNAREVYSSTQAQGDPAVLAAVRPYHDKTVAYVNSVVAQSTQEMSAATSRFEDTPIMDYIQMVQTEAVTKGLAGTAYANLPVLSIAAPFSRTAVFPKGDVTIRDIASLYIYDNTLEARLFTGAQVKEYLEYSAKYFAQVPAGGTFDPETMTSVVYNGQQVWDYNYDIMSGVRYQIDLSKPVGERIVNLTNLDGTPVDPAAQYVVAINNYRSSGGGGFPGTGKQTPVVYNQLQEIRQLLIDWGQAHQVIDPSTFYDKNWELVVAGQPVR